MDGSNREIIEYDLLIKNGQIIDGTGKPSFLSDIGIKDGIIKKIGKIKREAPQLGQDNNDILSEIGYSKDEISILEKSKII